MSETTTTPRASPFQRTRTRADPPGASNPSGSNRLTSSSRNCGGIPRDVAINYAFKMGREPDDDREHVEQGDPPAGRREALDQALVREATITSSVWGWVTMRAASAST